MSLLLLLPALVQTPPALAAPAPARSPVIKARLGREFTLRLGEVARFAAEGAELRIKSFVNSPCPKGARCIWSGQGVSFELKVGKKSYLSSARDTLIGEAPFDVRVVESDYETRARFLAQRPASPGPH